MLLKDKNFFCNVRLQPISLCVDWSISYFILRIFRWRPSLAFSCPPNTPAKSWAVLAGWFPWPQDSARLLAVGQAPIHVTATIKTFIALITTAFWKSGMEKDLDLNQITGSKSLCGNWWVGTFLRSSTQSNIIHHYTVVASLYFPDVCNVHYVFWFKGNFTVNDACAARCFSSGCAVWETMMCHDIFKTR